MKTKLVGLAAALLCAPLFAEPGSYVPVTFALTVTTENAETSRPLKTGNTEFTYSTRKYALGNTAILAEATRRGILSTSDFKGWQIVAVYDRDTNFRGFFAFNRTLNQSAYLGPIVAPDDEDGQRVDSGKVQRTPANAIASGTLSFMEAGPLYLLINGEFFDAKIMRSGSERLRAVAAGGFQWVPGSAKGTAIGDTNGGAVFNGKLNTGAGVQVANIATAFPFPED